MLYNENAESVHKRLRMFNQTIQERKPTLWEKVGGQTAPIFSIFNNAEI
jgi:hypothetical protein